MADVISVREFARRMEVSLPAVQKAVKNGRIQAITDEKGRLKGIDWETQKDAWIENSNPAFRRKQLGYAPDGAVATPFPAAEGKNVGGRPRKDGKATVSSRERAEKSAEISSAISDEHTQPKAGMSLADIKRAREAVNLQLDKLKLDVEKKKYVAAELVRKDMENLAATVKAALLSIPDRISSEIAGITDQHIIHSIILNEINSSMEELIRKCE